LTNTFARVVAGRKVEKALIGFSRLDDERGLSVHGKNERALGLLQKPRERR
jgi:hypothetical protein